MAVQLHKFPLKIFPNSSSGGKIFKIFLEWPSPRPPSKRILSVVYTICKIGQCSQLSTINFDDMIMFLILV